ncbi:MAG: universal stress protein [Chloroflexaceae bacterium]|nr:universal stress protein [Chloroflexaceae bacterium]NJO83077.1 universal stress protein [Blastochloris sp.]
MKTILVPLDTSGNATRILPYIRTLALAMKTTVHLLHIWEFDAHLLYSRYQTMREYFRGLAKELQVAGIDVTTEMQIGTPATRIVETAERLDALLIAMVTHGYSGFKRWAVGSVTDKVVQTSQRPVLIVQTDEQHIPSTYNVRRILVPLDGSPLALQGLEYALKIAAPFDAAVHLLHVVEPHVLSETAVNGVDHRTADGSSDRIRERQYQAEQELTALRMQLHNHSMPISIHVAVGYAAEHIVDAALEQQIDLIVMATHGRGGMERWALGSVADKVLHATQTPLMFIRANTRKLTVSSEIQNTVFLQV